MNVYQEIKEALELYRNTRVETNTPFAPLCMYQDVLSEEGYYRVSDWDPNGWEVEFWDDYYNPDTKDWVMLTGSLYYGDFKFDNVTFPDSYTQEELKSIIDNYAY